MPNKQTGFAHVLLILFLLVGLGAGLYVIKNPTVLNPRASEMEDTDEVQQLTPSSPTTVIEANPNPVNRQSDGEYRRVAITIKTDKTWGLHFNNKEGKNCGGTCDSASGWTAFNALPGSEGGAGVGITSFDWQPPAYITGVHTIAIVDTANHEVISPVGLTFQEYDGYVGVETGQKAQCSGLNASKSGLYVKFRPSFYGDPSTLKLWISSNDSIGKDPTQVTSWTGPFYTVQNPTNSTEYFAEIPTNASAGEHLILMSLYDSAGKMLDGNIKNKVSHNCLAIITLK